MTSRRRCRRGNQWLTSIQSFLHRWDSGKQSGGKSPSARIDAYLQKSKSRLFASLVFSASARVSVTLSAAAPHHGRHVPRGGAEGAPDVQRVVRHPGHRVRQRGTSRVARVPRRHAPPLARWRFVGGPRRRPRRVRSPPSSPSTPSSPRAQALEIRAFVDGSSANQNRYHYAVFARRDIADGDVVVRSIPKRACLSARTCLSRPQLRAERLGGGLALRIAIMHERSLGELSAWHGYSPCSPTEASARYRCSGPKARCARCAARRSPRTSRGTRVSLREDYDEHVVEGLCVSFAGVRSRPVSRARGFELYLEAASAAASRAFSSAANGRSARTARVRRGRVQPPDGRRERAVFGADAGASAEDSGEEVFSGDETSLRRRIK